VEDGQRGGWRRGRADGVSSIIIGSNDYAAAWAVDENGQAALPGVPGGDSQREFAWRTGVNIVMYALTGNYKADQVHVPALLERLGAIGLEPMVDGPSTYPLVPLWLAIAAARHCRWSWWARRCSPGCAAPCCCAAAGLALALAALLNPVLRARIARP
jgi:hypothetical protein